MRSLNIDKVLVKTWSWNFDFYRTTVILLNFSQKWAHPGGSQPQMYLHENKPSKSRSMNVRKLKGLLDKLSHLCLPLFPAEEWFKMQGHWVHQQEDKALGCQWLTAKCWQGDKEMSKHFSNGHGQNPMAKKNGITRALNNLNQAGRDSMQLHFLLQACLAGRSGEQKANLSPNGKMIAVGRALGEDGLCWAPTALHWEFRQMCKPRAHAALTRRLREHLTVSGGQRQPGNE